MSYMKFCERCGNSNTYDMPYCTHCGYRLATGNSLDYQQARQNFSNYMDFHPDEKSKFDNNHFQICANCHRKCPLNMQYCGWCGTKLNQVDQYNNYRTIVTTASGLPNFTYQTIKTIWYSINQSDYHEISIDQLMSKAILGIQSRCESIQGNTILGLHFFTTNHGNSLIAYGTAVNRKPINNRY